MKALISPTERCESGYRVAEVEPDDKAFEVAQPLFWVACGDEVIADQFWYDPETQSFKPVPQPEPEPEQPTEE
jgi:hypothetical protein